MYGDRGNIEIAALWIVFGLLVNAVIDGWYLSLNKPDFDVICKKDSICVVEARDNEKEKELYRNINELYEEDSGPHDMKEMYKKAIPPEWKLEEMYNPTGVLCFLSHEPQPVPVDCQWNTISDKLFFD